MIKNQSPRKIVGWIAAWLSVAAVACGPAPLMAPVPKMSERDMDHAVVTFIRSSVISPTLKAEIWDRETPLGELPVRAFIQYKAEPGRHLFMARAEHSDQWSFIEANLITGEHYVVKVEVVPGGYTGRVELKPTSPSREDITRGDIDGWLTKLKGKTLIKEMESSYVDQRGAAAKKAAKSYDNDKMVPDILYPEDFWPDLL